MAQPVVHLFVPKQQLLKEETPYFTLLPSCFLTVKLWEFRSFHYKVIICKILGFIVQSFICVPGRVCWRKGIWKWIMFGSVVHSWLVKDRLLSVRKNKLNQCFGVPKDAGEIGLPVWICFLSEESVFSSVKLRGCTTFTILLLTRNKD